MQAVFKIILLVSVIGIALTVAGRYFFNKPKFITGSFFSEASKEKPSEEFSRLKTKASLIKNFITGTHYNSKICFLIDMKTPSGKKRFFIYDLQKDSILSAGLVAHGSCDNGFQAEASFSNTVNSGCSCKGKFSIGKSYMVRFGLAFKLHGLDSSNDNASKRSIVLHYYGCVPDDEIYPLRVCNSRGCPMVSANFLAKLKGYIENSPKPALLIIFQ